jgi:hypothetical protein
MVRPLPVKALEPTAVTDARISASVTTISQNAFGSCSSLTAITVNGSNANYSSVDGILFNKTESVLHQYPAGKTGNNSYNISAGVSSIYSDAFAGCHDLKSVTIPALVTSIGMTVFRFCYGLTDITVNWAASTNIPDISNLSVFYGASSNITLYIASGTSKSDYTAQGWPDGFNYIACTSGTFGASNLKWALCDGVLTIEGTDAMNNFANYTLQPWASYRDDITDIYMGGHYVHWRFCF